MRWLMSSEADGAAEDFDIANTRFASECHEKWRCWVVVLVEESLIARSTFADCSDVSSMQD